MTVERVLFVDDDGVAARLAAGLLEAMHGDDYEAGLAAVDPVDRSLAVADVDTDRPVPSAKEVDTDGYKHVVTLDGEAKAHCPPVSPGVHYLHWSLPDDDVDELRMAIADRISRSFGKETTHTTVEDLPPAWGEEE